MDCFIKKIFEGKAEGDGLVHLQFQKFGRGEFKDKALVKASSSKGRFSIATTYEFANEFVRMLAEKLGNSSARVTGVVVSTRDLKAELDFKDIKQFAGVKQYVVDKEMNGKDIFELCEKFPAAFIGFSFSAGDSELKIKAKSPKSGKPSTKTEEAPNPDFCKLITTDKSIARSVLFDLPLESFKKVLIRHDFIITDIILPKGETEPAKIRELAKRKGKIIRMTEVDGAKSRKEQEFIV